MKLQNLRNESFIACSVTSVVKSSENMPKETKKRRDEPACRPSACVGTDKNRKKSYYNAVFVSATNHGVLTESFVKFLYVSLTPSIH